MHAKILVADYDEKSLAHIAEVIQRHGFTSILVKNGKDALDRAQRERPDACIIDPMLPGINGFTVSQRIRQSNARIPIIISTGVYKGSKYQRDAKTKYGVTAYLEKPYSEEELVAALKEAMPEKKPQTSAKPASGKPKPASSGGSLDKKIDSTLLGLSSEPRGGKKRVPKKEDNIDKLLEHTLSGIELSSVLSSAKKAPAKPSRPVQTPAKPKREAPPPKPGPDDADATVRVSADDLKREMQKAKLEKGVEAPRPGTPSQPAAGRKPPVTGPAPPPAVKPTPQDGPPEFQVRKPREDKLTSEDIFGSLLDDFDEEEMGSLPPESVQKGARPEPHRAAPAAPPATPAPPAKPQAPKKAPPRPAEAKEPPVEAPAKPSTPPPPAPKPLESREEPMEAAQPVDPEPKVPSEVIATSEAKASQSRDAKPNEYQLLSKIAAGGMAEVWKARLVGEKGFEKIVAIKKILAHLSDNDDFITMFIDEARVAANLTHPNIAQIYELGKMDNSFFIAMEYVSGNNLRNLLSLCQELGVTIPAEIVVFLGMKLCSALNYAHNKKDYDNRNLNIVHRDISPQNILISTEGEIKLVDFGIAKASIKASQTVAGSLKGKLLYMSPEQAEGKALDQRSDVFSLANVMYECLTAKKLIAGDSELSILKNVREAKFEPPRKLNPSIPERLEQILLKALSKDVDDRYQSARGMENDLREFMKAGKHHISESDVKDVVRYLMARDVEKLRPAKPESVAQGKESAKKPDVIMPDTADIRAFEDEKIGVPRPKPEPKSRKGLWGAIAALLIILATVAALVFWPKAPSEPSPDVTGTSASSQQPSTPEPVGQKEELPLETAQIPDEGNAEIQVPPVTTTEETARVEGASVEQPDPSPEGDARAVTEADLEALRQKLLEQEGDPNEALRKRLEEKKKRLEALLEDTSLTEEELKKEQAKINADSPN